MNDGVGRRRVGAELDSLEGTSAGLCQVVGRGAAEVSRLVRVSRGRCDAGHLALGAEGAVACGTVLVGGKAAELKVVVDAPVDGEESLRVPC